MAKRSTTDYEEMSLAVQSGEYSVRSPLEMGATLRMGRPAKGTPSAGKTPPLGIRLPESIRGEIKLRVKAGESSSESELIRQALVEYFGNHPTVSR